MENSAFSQADTGGVMLCVMRGGWVGWGGGGGEGKGPYVTRLTTNRVNAMLME